MKTSFEKEVIAKINIIFWICYLGIMAIIIILLTSRCAKEPMTAPGQVTVCYECQPEPATVCYECQPEPATVCYECQLEGGTVYFLNTSPKEMQLVIRAWQGRGVMMECNEMECE